jgi:amino acid transporter
MTTTASQPRPARAKATLYARALIALATIGAWAIAGVTGALLWMTPRGAGFGDLAQLGGVTRGAWLDVHVAVSFLAAGLTLAHLIYMRRGVLAYLRLLATGQRRAGPSRRPVARIVIVRAMLVVGLLSFAAIVTVTGLIPWLGPDGRRSGQQVLASLLTKRSWLDVHLVAGLLIAAIATAHNIVVRHGLLADLWLLATGQRRVPRRTTGPRETALRTDLRPSIDPDPGLTQRIHP